MAVGSPSNPKWVEHWLNKVEHCTSHLEGVSLDPFGPQKKGIWGPQNPPKITFFGPWAQKKEYYQDIEDDNANDKDI